MKTLIIALLLISTTQACAKLPEYDRKSWGYPQDADKNCRNTRNEILTQRSIRAVVYKKPKTCTVVFGQWEDYYYDELMDNVRQIQIDHVVPLQYAHKHGGANWSKERKREFANDPENLVITSSKTNRQKGSKGIDQWLPLDKVRACRYITKWQVIKRKYGLKITQAEEKTIKAAGCVKEIL